MSKSVPTAAAAVTDPALRQTSRESSATGDEPLQQAVRVRDLRVEHRLNLVRGVVLAPLVAADMLYGWQAGILSPSVVAEWLIVLATFLSYFALVHRFTTGEAYRPWLKYATTTIDVALTLLLYAACRKVDFLVRGAPADGVAVFVGFLVLLNVLSAFRRGRSIIVYSTVLCSAAALYLAAAYSGSLALVVYSPLLLVSCGMLTYSLSSSMTRMFSRLEQRRWLLRFLPHAVVDGIENGTIALHPGGVQREVTVLLADLRGFTTFAEGRDAYEVVRVLNDHFAAMAAVLWRHGGMIDKFIGDAVLAVFGLPAGRADDAARALAAALEMQRVLHERNRNPGVLPVALSMGIALHSGMVVAGNVGADSRLEYTVVGDVVNVAARIEELNKHYGTGILLSEATRDRLPTEVAVREVGEATLRGRTRQVRLFTPV